MSEVASLPLCVEHETGRPVMKTGMTRLGRRLSGRTLAVPTIPHRRLAARGGQRVALARARDARPDIIELILPDHQRIRRLLRNDEDAGYGENPGCPEAPTPAWFCRCGDSRPVRMARRSWECARCSRFLAFAEAPPEALLGPPGPVGSEPRWLSGQPAGFRAQVHQAPSCSASSSEWTSHRR